MAKLSKEKRSMLLNIGFIFLTLLLMLYLVSRAGDPKLILTAFTTINPWWLAAPSGALPYMFCWKASFSACFFISRT